MSFGQSGALCRERVLAHLLNIVLPLPRPHKKNKQLAKGTRGFRKAIKAFNAASAADPS